MLRFLGSSVLGAWVTEKVDEQCFSLSRRVESGTCSKKHDSSEQGAEDRARGTMTHHVSSYTSQHCSDLSLRQKYDWVTTYHKTTPNQFHFLICCVHVCVCVCVCVCVQAACTFVPQRTQPQHTILLYPPLDSFKQDGYRMMAAASCSQNLSLLYSD